MDTEDRLLEIILDLAKCTKLLSGIIATKAITEEELLRIKYVEKNIKGIIDQIEIITTT